MSPPALRYSQGKLHRLPIPTKWKKGCLSFQTAATNRDCLGNGYMARGGPRPSHARFPLLAYRRRGKQTGRPKCKFRVTMNEIALQCQAVFRPSPCRCAAKSRMLMTHCHTHPGAGRPSPRGSPAIPARVRHRLAPRAIVGCKFHTNIVCESYLPSFSARR
jgi:hypothetical protein